MSFRPWLALPAKLAHDLAPIGLELATHFSSPVVANVHGFTWTRKNRTLHFRNPLGIAGGVDKDGTQISGWNHFGAGFVEIGTVTPRPQSPNPGRIIGRDNASEALWNRMGFPGVGAPTARAHLREWRMSQGSHLPVFVNIGKQRETSLDEAAGDYVWLIDFFSDPRKSVSRPEVDSYLRPLVDSYLRPLVDAFVINISSPNTKGLRELFERERLYEFLRPLAERLKFWSVPGLLKLSPDMDDDTLETAIAVAVDLDIDGFIATNTTARRPPGIDFPQEGGLSGAPLRELSTDVLKKMIHHLGPNRAGRLLVSAGGVLNGTDAIERLRLGADLVETYSGLVFGGPRFFDRALRDLACVADPRRLV